jgi:hypothetical protein
MRRIPDQDHSAAMPLVEIDPLDCPKVELLIRLQDGEIRRDRRTEFSKAAPEAFEAPWKRVLETFPVNSSKTISATFAHRDQPEKASVPQENHHLDHPWRTCRYHAAPDQLLCIGGHGRGHRELARYTGGSVATSGTCNPGGKSNATYWAGGGFTILPHDSSARIYLGRRLRIRL